MMNDDHSNGTPPPLSTAGTARRESMLDELTSSMSAMHQRRRVVRRAVGSAALIAVVAIGGRLFWPSVNAPTVSPRVSNPMVAENTIEEPVPVVTSPRVDIRVVSNVDVSARRFIVRDDRPASWIEVLDSPRGAVDVAVIESDAGLAFALAEFEQAQPVIRVGEALEIPGLVLSPVRF